MPLRFEKQILSIPCDLKDGTKEVEVSLSKKHDDDIPKRVSAQATLELGFEAMGSSPQAAMLDLSKRLKELHHVLDKHIKEQK